jgi:hypothetical protein
MPEPLTLHTVSTPVDLPVFVFGLARIRQQLLLASQALDELRQSHPQPVASNLRAAYMSPWKSHLLNPKLQPLCDSVCLLANVAAEKIAGVDLAAYQMDFVVMDCWAAVYEHSDHAKRHNHFPADFSAVAYLEAEPGCAPIVFGGRVAVQPEPETLIMFPGLLDHEVPATAGRRSIVAFNLGKRALFGHALTQLGNT